MATEMKRFTIGVDEDTVTRLDRLKQARYYNKSQNKMIQDLICLGLTAIAEQGDNSPDRKAEP